MTNNSSLIQIVVYQWLKFHSILQYNFYYLTFKSDLHLQPTWTNVSNGTTTPWEQLRQINLKSMHKCRSYGLEKLILWPFYHLTFKWDLDLQHTWINTSNDTSSQGEQLCQIILKSMHKCRSYGPDKLNLWPFYHLTFKCDLDFQPTWTNVSMGLLLLKENNVPNYLKSMHKCRSYGPDKLNLLPLQVWPWPSTLKMFQMALLLLKDQLCQIKIHA